MPKVGMGPIRREQICRAAAAVIARVGFPGTTMRAVAEEAGVSTGMLNHYFANRADMLVQSLLFASETTQGLAADSVESAPPGEERVRALLSAALPRDPQAEERWRVWIAAYGEAVRLQSVRDAISRRLVPWYEIIEHALEGFGTEGTNDVPIAWRFDGLLNGLVIQALVSTPGISMDSIEETLVAYVRHGA
jgi:AcrR family transcriptional regulator